MQCFIIYYKLLGGESYLSHSESF